AEMEELTWRLANGGTVVSRAGARGRLIAIPEGVSGAGFRICESCGWGTVMVGKLPRSHRHPLRDRECRGRLQARSLAHPYETDILELSFDGLALPEQDNTTLNSLLSAILEGAAERLHISRDDIDGALYPRPGGRRALVVFDTVPGGAGNSARIARSLDEVLPHQGHDAEQDRERAAHGEHPPVTGHQIEHLGPPGRSSHPCRPSPHPEDAKAGRGLRKVRDRPRRVSGVQSGARAPRGRSPGRISAPGGGPGRGTRPTGPSACGRRTARSARG